MVRVVALLSALLAFALAHAQTPEVANRKSWTNGNAVATFGMNVGGLTDAQQVPGAKVSGTKVELVFHVGVKGDGITAPGDPGNWNSAKVVAFEVTCNGATPALHFTRAYDRFDGGFNRGSGLQTLNDPQPEGPDFVSGAQAVRIASTELPDGGTISFTIRARVRFRRIDSGAQELPSPAPVEEERTIVATLTVCNRVLLLATKEIWNGSSYAVSPTAPLVLVAKAVVDSARPYWEGTLHHTVLPTNEDDVDNWSKSTLFSPLKAATALFWCTHGESQVVRASSSDEMRFLPNPSASELRGLTYSGRVVPDMNAAFFYSCEAASNACAYALKLMDYVGFNYVQKADRGLAGFPHKLHENLYSPVGATLDAHSTKLMEYLAAETL